MIATRERLVGIICDSFSRERQEAERLADGLISLMADYGKVLEESEKRGEEGSIALPESLLPGSKESIKEATKFLYLACSDQEFGNSLRVGYSGLATFVSDEKVKQAAKTDSPSSSADVKAQISAMETGMQIIMDITEQTAELEEEFANWRKEMRQKLGIS